MGILENRIPPPIVALTIAVGMWFLAPHGPTLPLPAMTRDVVAAVVAVCGIAVALAASATFRKAQTTVNPLHPERATSLVDGGVFRYTRNPMYVGVLLVLVALATYLASPLCLLGPLLFVGYITRFQILPEERALEALFGDAYRDYKRRVRRWL